MKNIKKILLYLLFLLSISALIFSLIMIRKNYLNIKNLYAQNKYIVKLFSGGVRNMPKAHGDLREKQKLLIKSLVEFDQIAKNNKIEYWLSYGTLIGAYRHNGFIPWDDDIDISMTEENLMKLRKLLQDPKYGLKVVPQHDNSKGSLWFLAYEYDDPNVDKIDIFSHVCVKRSDHKKFLDFIKWTQLLKTKYFKNKKYDYWDDIKIDCNKDDKDMLIAARFIYSRLGSGISVRESYFEKSDIYPLKKMMFEGYMFPVPANSLKVLEMNYGPNIMELPNNFGYSAHIGKWN